MGYARQFLVPIFILFQMSYGILTLIGMQIIEALFFFGVVISS